MKEGEGRPRFPRPALVHGGRSPQAGGLRRSWPPPFPQGEGGMRKAWRVVWDAIPDGAGIYCAPTRGEALARAYRTLREYGYELRRRDLQCRRAPEYDAWAGRQTGRRLTHGTLEGYVKQEAGVG
jgi:hypothetical protein